MAYYTLVVTLSCDTREACSRNVSERRRRTIDAPILALLFGICQLLCGESGGQLRGAFQVKAMECNGTLISSSANHPKMTRGVWAVIWGKSMVLKLINYCLGGKDREICADPDNAESSYQLVETYLREQNIVITLELVDSLNDVPLKRTTIRRNFLKGKKAIREIDGQQVAQGAFLQHLGAVLMPQLPKDDKPAFRQAISHNIRYNEQSLTRTLHTSDKFTRDIEYEALSLYAGVLDGRSIGETKPR